MDNPQIEQQASTDEPYAVKYGTNMVDAGELINTLTILTSSSKELNHFENPQVTTYLKSAGLIEEPQPNEFRVVDMSGCVQLSNYLDTYITDMIAHYSAKTPSQPE